MTNKEIKFELGKIALTRCDGDLTESLRNIYEWIIEEPEEVISGGGYLHLYPLPVEQPPTKNRSL